MGKSRVVLATGDEWIANLIGAVLRDADLEVIVANSGEEALSLLLSRADAVLVDAALPDDATSFITHLRQSTGASALCPLYHLRPTAGGAGLAALTAFLPGRLLRHCRQCCW